MDSEYKSIKYNFVEEKNNLFLKFKLAHYIETSKLFQYYQLKYDLLSSVKVNTFSLTEISKDQVKDLNDFITDIDITNEKNYQSKDLKNLHDIYGISSQRRLQGSVFGFDNFELNHDIFVKQTNLNKDKKLVLNLVDLIPEQFDVLFSTLKIHYEVYNEKGEVHTKYFFDSKNFKHFLKLSFNITEMEHPILWSYDKKRKIFVNLSGIKLLPNSKLRISYRLRKKLLNFEAFDNEMEFGYKVPSGIMLYGFENEDQSIFITDQMYFNIPTVDNTMPFNVIALTSVVIGVFLIQTLTLFLTDKSKSFITKIKEKVMGFFKKKENKLKIE